MVKRIIPRIVVLAMLLAPDTAIVEAALDPVVPIHDTLVEYGTKSGDTPASDLTFSIIYHSYKGWIIAVLAGFVVMVAALLHIVRLIKKLGTSNLRLRAEVDKRKTMASVLLKSEFRLVRALKEAHAANEVKNQFLANTNHEIRTPMNGIIGMTGLLQGTRLSEEQQDYVNTIQASAQSLLRIINDILDYSKIEADTLDLETIEFELPAVLEDLVAQMSPKFTEKGLEFAYVLDADVPTHFAGDVNRLLQVLTYLMDNAAKFTQFGEVFLHISLQQENDAYAMIRFRVKDTGIGIDPDRVDRLFSSFTQADISLTRKYGGTGLGLTISQHLVTKMGGDIGVISAPGKGSEFWFTVKLKKQSGIASRKPVIAHDFSTKRILIVDDNATNRHVLQGYLKSWGIRYACADGAPNALAMLHQAVKAGDPFDLAVIDHPMPNISGKELGRSIMEDPLLNDVKTIMLTSAVDPKEARRSEAAGFCASLTKPVSIDRFFNCLSLVFGSSGAQTAPTTQKPSPITVQTVSAGEQSGPRILIAEDNRINQKVTVKILKKYGCEAHVVNNGREAVDELTRNTYDAVLLDLQMPEMDGFEAAKAIRDPSVDCLNPKIPIIALTANAQEETRDKCLQAGMDDFIAKPVSPKDLVDKIRQWIEKFGERRPPTATLSN